MIKNLKADENNWFLEGTFDSDSLFQGEMSVSIFTDDGATVEDAEACIAQYQQLKKNAAFCANLQEMLAAFFLYMYDAWKEMGMYDGIVAEIEPVKQGYEAGESLLSFSCNYFKERFRIACDHTRAQSSCNSPHAACIGNDDAFYIFNNISTYFNIQLFRQIT